MGADCFRVMMLMLVMVYHTWVINGSVPIDNRIISSIIILGGEVGVTGFFVLSGWSIYQSLKKQSENYWLFLKKRFIRIAPEYYLSIVIVLFFSSGAGWLSKEGIKSVIATMFFCQNILPGVSAVNGVLWTMSVTAMFYIVSPVLNKMLCKFNTIFVVFSVSITILMKYIFLHWGPIYGTYDSFYLSRQTIITDLDNFVLGMAVAHLMNKYGTCIIRKNFFSCIGIIASLCGVIGYGILGMQYGIHTDNVSGYGWHSVIAILLAINLFFWCILEVPEFFGSSRISQFIRLLAKHQYGIYVFHLLVIQNLVSNSELIVLITNKNYILAQAVIVILATAVGILMSWIIQLAINGIRNEMS